ncbi:hypothetical protein VM1G_02835 [Cytospora mali]|uniref:Prokaryotic phospholipase A2-domain-containing protein n=1 Tax=Cytospora mali TaxID=578113 RepID=A0A194VTT4_CYTMA|nr:hypothetical protein VM1G_02835 [Valsa mali]
MKIAMLLLSVISTASAVPSPPNVSHTPDFSQIYKGSACSDEVLNGFNIVICELLDKSVIHWPPTYLNTRNISNPYGANCANETSYSTTYGRNLTATICDYGDVLVGHWPKEMWQLPNETSVRIGIGAFSKAVAHLSKTPEEVTDELLLKTTLDEFDARREKRDPAYLIWDSDGCTNAPDNPGGFNFLPACQRHDFGYRNYRAQNRLTKAARKKIDKQLKAE